MLVFVLPWNHLLPPLRVAGGCTMSRVRQDCQASEVVEEAEYELQDGRRTRRSSSCAQRRRWCRGGHSSGWSGHAAPRGRVHSHGQRWHRDRARARARAGWGSGRHSCAARGFAALGPLEEGASGTSTLQVLMQWRNASPLARLYVPPPFFSHSFSTAL